MSWSELFEQGDSEGLFANRPCSLNEIRRLAESQVNHNKGCFFDDITRSEALPFIFLEACPANVPMSHKIAESLLELDVNAHILNSLGGLSLGKYLPHDGERGIAKLMRQAVRGGTVEDEYQVWESKAYGFASLALRPSLLSYVFLQYLIELCRDLNMEPVLRCQSLVDLQGALETDARVIQLDFARQPALLAYFRAEGKLQQLVKRGGDGGLVFICEMEGNHTEQIETWISHGFKHFSLLHSGGLSGLFL